LKKAYKAPFWSLIILIMAVTALFAYLFFQSGGIEGAYWSQIFLTWLIIVAVLTGEALFYWFNRWRITRRSWATVHISLLYLGLLVVPVVYVATIFYLRYNENSTAYYELAIQLAKIQGYVILVSLVAAHLFFIATIIRTLLTRKQQPSHAADSPNILDDFDR